MIKSRNLRFVSKSAKKTLEKAGFNADEHIIVTKDIGISKNFDLNSSNDLKRIKETIIEKVDSIYDK